MFVSFRRRRDDHGLRKRLEMIAQESLPGPGLDTLGRSEPDQGMWKSQNESTSAL
jgi:hypothetical protein